MLSHRVRNVEILRWITWGLTVVSLAGGALTAFFLFVAHLIQSTAEISSWSVAVDPQRQACMTSAVVTVVCSLLAIGFFIWHRIARNILDRYAATHCSQCGFDLGSIIQERRNARNATSLVGEPLPTSLYFEVTCQVCKTQRVVRE
jgi:hypothetical protein